MLDDGLLPRPPAQRLALPEVTLCAVSSTNVFATLQAMETCLDYADFADAVLFTDAIQARLLNPRDEIGVHHIAKVESSRAYSEFLLRDLVDFVNTKHCLLVQWDGHIIDPARWRPEFLDYDYVGASWPQFIDGGDVGNGGFSLRSRKLMEACRQPDFEIHHPEDVAICRINRRLLESQGMRFAPANLADAFAAERAGDPRYSFGYHGAFLMPEVLGPEKFWDIYRTFDDRSSIWHDFWKVLRQMRKGKKPILRWLSLISARISDAARRRSKTSGIAKH